MDTCFFAQGPEQKSSAKDAQLAERKNSRKRHRSRARIPQVEFYERYDMKNIIVGTAGHVDHGKTCLIKALTGTDTDRLKEEKKRGITIELGFASFPPKDDIHIGIIDVPGHEKFVKNMLAGIGGIDLVLFVVALDEGVMPQSREHFEIMKSLGIRKGILVFTKKDMVEEEWAQMVEEDTRQMVKGSFLEDAPSVMVSSYTGENIDALRELIFSMVKEGSTRQEEKELFRLPIDRVFTMEGFGTVITGTLLEGSVKVGDEIMIYPGEQIAKVRGIQNHNAAEETAFAGQRTAINLTGVKKEDINRGDVLAVKDGLPLSNRMDVKVRLFDDTRRQLKSHDHVHISYGSAQTVCKVVLLDRDILASGEEGLAQLIFDQPVPVRHGDKFILRFYSPVESFAGGTVLEPEARKHKKMGEEVLLPLQMLSGNEILDKVEAAIMNRSGQFPEVETLSRVLDLGEDKTSECIEKLKKSKKILAVKQTGFIHKTYWEEVVSYVKQLMEEFHLFHPMAPGMERQELNNKMGTRFHLTPQRQEDLLLELLKRGILEARENVVTLIGFESSYSGSQTVMKEAIETIYKEAWLEAPATEDVLKGFKDKKEAKQIIANLLKDGVLVRVNPAVYMKKEAWEKAVELLKQAVGQSESGEITLGEYRDCLNTSRKYAVQLLEAFDQQKITKKNGEARVLL